jgi:uncharacterized protein (TIRG00374 family)
VFGVVVAVGLGLLWYWLVDVDQVVKLLQNVNFSWLIQVLIISVVASWLSALRLTLLTKPLGEVSTSYLWGLNFIGGVTSLLIPFQGGGFLRAYLLKEKLRSRYSTCLAVIVFDFFLSKVVLLFFSLLAVIYFIPRGVVYNLSFWLVGILLLLSTAILIKSRWMGILVKLVLAKLSKFQGSTGRYLERIVEAQNQFRVGWKSTSKDVWRLILTGGLSVVIFSFSGLRMYLIFQAFGADVGYWPVLFAGAIFGLSGLLPGTPLRIGQYELFGLLIYVWLLGLDSNLVAAVVLLSHVFGITFTLCGGSLATLSMNVWPGGLRKSLGKY